MSTPRRGVRRSQTPRRPATAGPAARPKPATPNPAPKPTPAAAGTGVTNAPQGSPALWVRVLDWGAWIVLWVSALGAGYLFGRIEVAKVIFMAVMLAITVLPWLRWVWPGSKFLLAPTRIAWVHGLLAIFVALVFTLTGQYLVALPLLVVQLVAAAVVLVKSPRTPATEAPVSPR